MNTLNRRDFPGALYPERIIQFGEGNFLRAFVDWQIDLLNEHTDLNAGVVVVRPIQSDFPPSLSTQDGVIGTVQLITDQPENQPHRADVAKLLVHEKARRKGAAMALMEELEVQARARDISVLVLDTSTGSGAETFYQRAGWQKVGEIPRYALMPDGAMTATSVFYKFL